MSDISVLLIGASGALGKPLLDELQRQKKLFKRIAILTSPERAKKFDGLDVEVVVKSFYDPATYEGMLRLMYHPGFTHVISAVGNDMMILQPAMIEASTATGRSIHWYASEWNSDIAQEEIQDMRYFRDKQSVRAYLRRKAASTPGFRYTLMITGIFTEWAVDAFYGFDHDRATAELFGSSGESWIGVTSIPDIARYTIDSLRLEFEGSGRTLRVQGWRGSLTDLIAALEDARGRKYAISYTDPSVARKKQKEARLRGDDLAEMTYSIKALLASGYGVADGAGPLDNDSFDFEPEQPLQTFRRVFGSAS